MTNDPRTTDIAILSDVADRCIEARRAAVESGRAFLIQILDMALIETGRELAALVRKEEDAAIDGVTVVPIKAQAVRARKA